MATRINIAVAAEVDLFLDLSFTWFKKITLKWKLCIRIPTQTYSTHSHTFISHNRNEKDQVTRI